MPAIENVVLVPTDHVEPTPAVPAVAPQILPSVTTVATEVLKKEEQPQAPSCWQKIGGAYEVVKTKLTTWWTKVEDWTHRTFPPTVAKCVLAFVKFLPFAVALLFVPSTIVFAAFAFAVVVRFVCPEVFSNNPKWHGVFSAAARIMGVYCGILGVWSGATMSFSPSPHLNLIYMVASLACGWGCFYAANNEWTPKPHEPSQHAPHKIGHKSSRPNTPAAELSTSSRPATPALPGPVAASPKPPLHPLLVRTATPTNNPPLLSSLAPKGATKPVVKGGTFTQPLTGSSSALANRRTLPGALSIEVPRSTVSVMPEWTPPIQASSSAPTNSEV